ncbi:SMP-30/gluconolactonase/LRE family protein [Glacieibacterium sp.]|uniref:SMP-30/gluconolactonase/LRE family protein n=1 Tax=Glacieibacterium sp. TaxID=2860237 RepID=UPI003B009AC4
MDSEIPQGCRQTPQDGWRCLWPLSCELGEGPVWVVRDQSLWFVDIEAPAIHRFDPASGDRFSWTPPCRVGSIAPRATGGFVAGTERGFALVDPVAGTFEPIDHPERHLPTNRFNDGKVDPAGAFWAGTMDDNKQAAQGSLYRLGPDLEWVRKDDGYRITNGPAFSPDGTVIYHTDTVERRIYAFDLAADGTLSDKRVLIDWPHDCGNPDGMTVDAQGYLWVACWGGWGVRRVSPSGQIVASFDLPCANITSCAFGGPDLDRLFVTSARQALDADQLEAQPLAGGLFELFPGVRGCPPVEFAG